MPCADVVPFSRIVVRMSATLSLRFRSWEIVLIASQYIDLCEAQTTCDVFQSVPPQAFRHQI